MRRLGLAAATLILALPLTAQNRWFHLRVEDHDDRATRVSINLPLQAVTAFLAAAPRDLSRGTCRAQIGDREITMRDLRQILGHLREFPAGGVRLERDGAKLNVRRDAEFLVLEIDKDYGDSAEVRMPFALAEALSSGPGEAANLQAAAARMADAGAGEILLVGSDGAKVRMWIDQQPEAGGEW